MGRQGTKNSEAMIINEWLAWWDARKRLIFIAFGEIDAPISNLSEVIHAGWKKKRNVGLSLLET